MSKTTFTEATDNEFLDAMCELDKTKIRLKQGTRIEVTVASANEKGILVNCGEKVDGFIPAAETSIEDEYNPANYETGMKLEVMVSESKPVDGSYMLSKKRIDLVKEGDKVVDTIRNNEVFTLIAEKSTKGGLVSKLGTYNVFVPASHIKERYVKEEDLVKYVGKPLKLVALSIDDTKKRILASQKQIIIEERKIKEETFWANVVPGVIVTGAVKSISKFGAFVSVDGFDCLVHIGDIAWNKFKNIEDILTIKKKYDFVVLKADKATNKVSLGYKQLQKHPFDQATENHPIGSVSTAKVTSILPFGLFVELEKDIEGLVHVSEASRQFVKDLNESFKVGDEVEVKTLAIDFESKKFTLSIKACLPELEEDEASEKKAYKPRTSRKNDNSKSDSNWSEDKANNPFADLAELLKTKD